MMRSVIVIAVMAAGCAGDPACDPAPGFACDGTVATCETETMRCSCDRYWFCESLECPIDHPIAGDTCDRDGLTCAPGFEDPGIACVSPEQIWVDCSVAYIDLGGRRWWCPLAPPTVGSPCCVEYPQHLLFEECPYVDDSGTETGYICFDSHWLTI